MERYTLREGGRVLCPTERLEAALERLAAFEDLACGLEEEQQSISRRLEELRGQRKERTVQFRELLAQKLVNSSLIQLLDINSVIKKIMLFLQSGRHPSYGEKIFI